MNTLASVWRIFGIACSVLFFAAGCGTESSAKIDPALPSMNCREAGTAMAGNYSNQAQATADASFKSIVMHIRPIWVDRIDGLWVYVEQSLVADDPKEEKPYRQRVYQIVDGNDADSVECKIYELPGDPLQFTGAWNKAQPLKSIVPDLLIPRAGCNVVLRKGAEGAWIGGTTPSQCGASENGAAYSTSDVTLTLRELRSWDRSYNAAGVQVWGSTTGPYIFVKTSR